MAELTNTNIDLSDSEYLRLIAPDFSVVEMLEEFYCRGNILNKGIQSEIFYIKSVNECKLYRGIFLFDKSETVDNKYFNNIDHIVYNVFPYGDRFIAIAESINQDESNNTETLSPNQYFENIYGVGF